MKIRILAIGQKMPAWVQTGFADYHKRIQPMIATELVELPAPKRQKNASPANLEQYKAQEGQSLLNALYPNETLWVLEVKGKMLSTEKLSDKLAQSQQQGNNLAIVIGGADGLCPSVLQRADFLWSLSDLTLPHPLVRVVLMEQLYRAMSLYHNHPYHRS